MFLLQKGGKKLIKTKWYSGLNKPYRYGWYERATFPQEKYTFMSFYINGQWYFQDDNWEFVESNRPYCFWRGHE